MPIPTITPLPPAPNRGQSGPDFADTADTFLDALPTLATEVNAFGQSIEAEVQAAIDEAATGAGFQPHSTELDALAALTGATFGRSLLTLANAAALRAAAGLVIGTNVQAYSANLAELAGTDPSAAGLAMLAAADAAAQKALIGAGGVWTQIGSPVSASGAAAVTFSSIPATYDDLLLVIEDLSTNSSSNINLAVGDASSFSGAAVLRSAAAAADINNGGVRIPGYRKPTGSFTYGLAALSTSPTISGTSGGSGMWGVDAGIQQLRISAAAGTFDAGTVTLYGR